MAGRRQVRLKGYEPRPPFFDEEERELIEGFEAAIDRGEILPNTPEELAEAGARFKAAVAASEAMVDLRVAVQGRDLARIDAIARQRGISREALLSSVLRDFAQSVSIDLS